MPSFPTPAFVPPSGANIPPAIAALQVDFSTATQAGYAAAEPVHEMIAQTVTFDSAGTIGSPAALTLGATGLDFALASGGGMRCAPI